MDTESVLAAVRGDRELLREMARLCLQEDAPRFQAMLREAAARGDFPGIEHAAHALKGLVGEFRAEAARAAAARIEEAARARQGEPFTEQIAAFEREFDRLAAVLRACV